MKIIILIAVLFVFTGCLTGQTLFINEFMADNDNVIMDEQGDYDDWLEIYNPNDEPVDLGGYFLSDSEDELEQYEIPTDVPDETTIPAGGFIIIWCDDDDDDGPFHTNFKLSADGEALYLTEWNGAVITDSYVFGAQTTDISEGRITDGADEWQFFSVPTPGETNNSENQPPLITEWQQLELLPQADQDVWVTANVTDDALDEVLINYQVDGNWLEASMYDDGTHNDGFAGDNIFGGMIPGYAAATYISYYLEAIDEDEVSSFYPVNAPDVLLKYESGWQHPQVFINEFMASNDTTITDPQGDYEDWIEIYNASEQPVDIGGWYLTDDFSNLTGWFQIPQSSPDSTTIEPGGFLLLWADEDSGDGIHHLGFKLSSGGESFGCFRYYGTTPVDTLTYLETGDDISRGRLPDGSENWTQFGIGLENPATPGYSNQPAAANEELNLPLAGINAVYPNPFFINSARSSVNLQVNIAIREILIIDLYNLKGQRIDSQKFYNLESGRNNLSFVLPEYLSSGVYLFKTSQNCLNNSAKLILTK